MASKLVLLLFFFQCLIGFAQDTNSETGAKRYLLFINGHRGPEHDKEIPINVVREKDNTNYWYKYDDTIIKRFNPSQAIYLDGHYTIKASMQKNFLHITLSYLASRFCWISGKSRWVINPKINVEGFLIRMTNGAEAGKNYLRSYCDETRCNSIKDTIDIVCHSFGYAYSLGFINAVKDKVKFGKILILAPESAGFYGVDWTLFDEVWQYGSNNLGKKAGSDPIYLQDGIAPQQQVKGLEVMLPNNGGRVFLPKNAKKGFIRSHHLSYWSWFYDIKPTDYGYFSK